MFVSKLCWRQAPANGIWSLPSSNFVLFLLLIILSTIQLFIIVFTSSFWYWTNLCDYRNIVLAKIPCWYPREPFGGGESTTHCKSQFLTFCLDWWLGRVGCTLKRRNQKALMRRNSLESWKILTVLFRTAPLLAHSEPLLFQILNWTSILITLCLYSYPSTNSNICDLVTEYTFDLNKHTAVDLLKLSIVNNLTDWQTCIIQLWNKGTLDHFP